MRYYVWYETPTHLCGEYVPHGELTEFKKYAKNNHWIINKIEKISSNGAVEVIYENN